MEVINKRYLHDHVSSYKNRGEKLGASNRFVRAHRVNEERKANRQDELSKRRGLASVDEQNASIEEQQVNLKQGASKARTAIKAKVSGKENEASQITDQRKAMLLKWREQRELKKKSDAATNSKKSAFAVRHIKYDESSSLFAPLNSKSTKKAAIKSTVTTAEKRVTRSSVRLASKEQTKPLTRGKTAPATKQAKSTKKTIAKQTVEKPKQRVTRQSIKASNSSNAKPNSPIKKKEVTENQQQSIQVNSPEIKNNSEKSTEERKEESRDMTSLAPANFEFTAPSGLYTFENYGKEFKFEPLSPRSAENFFQGISTCPSPKRDVVGNEGFAADKDPLEDDTSSIDQVPLDGRNSDKDESQDCNVNNQVTIIDSKYFRNLVSSETTRLNELCDKWEPFLESAEDLSEEVKGNIRTAIGQAQLLISQRFKQFSGLIDLSEDESAEKKATMSDLQGFWDMIYFQVEDVNTKLDALEKQKERCWVVEEKIVKKRKAKKIVNKKSELTKSTKTGGKSKIQELRAAMKAKMAEKKKEPQSQTEECSFITVLTPVKKNKRLGVNGEVILTPVRRSLRNTPISQSAFRATPKIVSTPKVASTTSPGLRLTPEVVSTNDIKEDKAINEANEDIQDKIDDQVGIQDEIQRENNSGSTDEDIKDVVMNEACKESHEKDSTQGEIQDGNASGSSSENTDEEVKVKSYSLKRRSCLRSSTKRTRKSSRVFFHSPEPSAHSTAGGTPGAVFVTPGLQKNKRSSNVVFTPVAVSFDSPAEEDGMCSIDAGHTPAMVQSGPRSLRRRKGTPASDRKRHLATPKDSLNTPELQDQGSIPKRRSLRLSARKDSSEEENFLPDRFLLPSSSSASDDDDAAQQLAPILTQPPSNEDHLLSFTPLKNSSDRFNKSLTPASALQALTLDTPEKRRDSVFYLPGESVNEEKQAARDNLICFSPLTE